MRAVGYIRVSTDKIEQAESLENQKALLLSFIKSRKYTTVDFYVDILSGTTAKRPELERLIEDASLNKYDVLVSKELSRLARNGQLSYELRNTFQSKNIHIITLDNAIDTTKSESKEDLFGLYAWLYEQESARISRRIKSVFREKQKEGLFLGSTPTYGYFVKDKRLFIRDDETPQTIKLIFDKFLNGWGYDKIARYLTEKKVPTPSQVCAKKNASSFWHAPTIRKILTNQTYIGNTVQHKETSISVVISKREKISTDKHITVENTHEAIITKEDFIKVQEILKRKGERGRGRTKTQKHLFTNFLFCGDCGTGMWYRNKYKQYICGKNAKHGKIACSSHTIKEADLKEIILSDIRSAVADMNLKDGINLKKETKQDEHSKKLKKIEDKISAIENRIDRLIDNYNDEKIEENDYLRSYKKNKDELAKLRNELKGLKGFKSIPSAERMKILKKEVDKFLQFEDLTQEMLIQLVRKIEIFDDKRLVIHYNFDDPEN